jgi:hypothetical protein
VATETTYTRQVVDQQETIIVRRKRSRDVALLPASEL